MTEKTKVCRCPACGGARAHYEAARSSSEQTCMRCPECSHEGLFDRWEVTRDWFVEIDLAPGEPLPTRLPPASAAEREAREATARWSLMMHVAYAREDRVLGEYATEAAAEQAMELARHRADAEHMWIVKSGPAYPRRP